MINIFVTFFSRKASEIARNEKSAATFSSEVGVALGPMVADQGRQRRDGWMQPPIADNKMNLDPSGLMKVPLQNHILSPLTHSLFL